MEENNKIDIEEKADIQTKKKVSKPALIKIIVWSFVAILLIAILVDGVVGYEKGDGFFSFINVNRYSNADKYSVGNGSVSGENIKDIEVNWCSGYVNIVSYDGDDIVISEKADSEIKEDKKLRYLADGDKLIIQYCKSGKSFFKNFSFNNDDEKELEIKLPVKYCKNVKKMEFNLVSSDVSMTNLKKGELSLDKVIIDKASGEIDFNNIDIKDVDISSVSGDTNIKNAIIDTVSMDQVSGDFLLGGKINIIEVDTVSGDVDIDTDICPSKMEVDGTSGDIKITIPENDGFKIEVDSIGGDFDSDFDMEKDDDTYTYKNGLAEFEFDSVSSDITINKK